MHAQLLAVCLLVLTVGAATQAAEPLRWNTAITNATDATQRAVALANEAIAPRTWRRFTPTTATALLVNDRWVWRGRIGYGKGDLEVIVTLRAIDSVADVQVAEWTSVPALRF